MVDKNNGSNIGPGGKTNEPGTGSVKKQTGAASTGPTNTGSTGAASGTTGSTGAASGTTGSGAAETQGTIRPVLVSIPLPPDGEKKNTKNRPSGLKYNKDKKKEPAASADTTVLVHSLIQGMFTITASRLGPHWQLTDDEAESIARPAANILGKYLDSESMEKYSDGAALTIALFVVVIPRLMMSKQLKEKGAKKAHGPSEQQPSQSRPAEASSAGNPGTNRPAATQSNVKSLLESISAANY